MEKETKTKSNSVTPRDAIVVEVIFILIAVLVNLIFRKVSLLSLLLKGETFHFQILLGLSIGLFLSLGLITFFILNKTIKNGIQHLSSLSSYSFSVLVLTGLFAGIGEELLFRATIQEFLGIWIASILFMLAHAQYWAVPPINRGKIIFALIAFGMGLLLGVIYLRIGLITAIAVHSLIDITGFIAIKKIIFKEVPI
jgi:membrane protease YdiL (CAAX protease family)